MNVYQEFKLRILEMGRGAAPFNVTTRALANTHGIPEPHVRQELISLADSGMIGLSAWDGERDRPHDEWEDADSFFSNQPSGGHVRIRLLEAGAQSVTKVLSATW